MNTQKLLKAWLLMLFLLAYTQFTNAQRETVLLDGQWNFCIDSVKAGLKAKWFKVGLPAGIAKPVNVPHTWNVKKETARYWGWGWYQRNINIPAGFADKNISLQFDAVYHDATIWLNGELVGEHKNSGYNKFFIDISKAVKVGAVNTLTVLADNSFSNTNIPYNNSFDWANDGGIIRSVNLISTGKVHINYAHITPRFELKDKLKPKGVISVDVNLSGTEAVDFSKIKFMVGIREENQVTSNVLFTGAVSVRPTNGIYTFSLSFDSINLWHFDNPNLYKFELYLYNNEQVSDNYTSNFGFREFKTDGYKFVFNGETVRLAGVESMPGSDLEQGMAESKAKLESNYLKKLEYLNATWTRFHWQQDDYVLDWCDRNGILVQEEIPIWGNRTKMNDTMLSTAKQHIKEMITNHYNHPCIIAWGVGNEMAGRNALNIKGVEEMYNYAKSLDNSRLANYVSNTLQQARHWMPKGTLSDASEKGDILMFNDYHSSWYRQAQAGMGNNLDTIRVENRPMPLVISEFGLCEPENWGDDNRRLKDMIYYYAVYESKFHVAGVIYFCINDYRTHMGGGKLDFHNTRVHGVYDLNFKPKPSAEVLREMNCPLEVSGLNRNREDLISIAIVGSNGFPSYTLRGYKAYWSENVTDYNTKGEMLLLPDIKPGQVNGINMQNKYKNKGVLTIENPRGKVIYQKVVERVDPYF